MPRLTHWCPNPEGCSTNAIRQKQDRFAVCILKVVGIGRVPERPDDGRFGSWYLCGPAIQKENEYGQ